MKIAYFVDATDVIGGAGNVLLNQAQIMSGVHRVVFVVPLNEKGEMNGEYVRRCQKAGLEYTGLIYTTAFRVQDIDIIKAWEDKKKIKEWALQEGIEFFHSVQLNIAVELASRELKIPHLMNIYQIHPGELALKYMDIFPQYHSCDSVMYCEIWSKYLGVKTCCIRPSAPLERMQKRKKGGDNQLNILMLGGFEKRKNQLKAIKAVEYCNKKGMDITLTIAGHDTTEYGEECKKYIQKNYLYKKIFVAGFHSNIIPLLLDNDCLLCASNEESFPSSIVEALTYSLLIVSTPVAGVPELLKDGVNAFVSKGFETEDIAESVMRCFWKYRNTSIEGIRASAEKLWEENFSIGVVRKKLKEYYLEILSDYQKGHKSIIQNKFSKQDIQILYKKLTGLSEGSIYILKRCYYYANLSIILKRGNIYIWGAGKYGKYAKELLEMLCPELRILAYIDQVKQGTYQGLPVIHPKSIDGKNVDYIFIGFLYKREEVIEYLEAQGYGYNEKVWVI